jgi:hypothetical protein
MSNESTKAMARRLAEGYFDILFQGRGIDIGSGNDPVTPDCVPWDIEQGDAQVLEGIPPEHFDWVYSSHCLEHLVSPPDALRRWWQVLKPGGILLVVVPDEDLYEQGCWPSRFNSDHRWTFTIGKSSSWSPVSLNLIELVGELHDHQILWLRTCDYRYDYSGGVWDRTQGPAEAQIEACLRKLPAPQRSNADPTLIPFRHRPFRSLTGHERPSDGSAAQGHQAMLSSSQRDVTGTVRTLRHEYNDVAPWREGAIYVDTLPIVEQTVAFGTLGTNGELGYESKQVQLNGSFYPHALSVHAPSRIVLQLDGRFARFHSRVAINGDVTYFDALTGFSVLADGKEIAHISAVTVGQEPQAIEGNIRGAQQLELVTSTDHFVGAHTVWLDPQVLPEGQSGRRLSSVARPPYCIPPISPPSTVRHKLVVHGNLGDHACYTGIPFGYWRHFGRKLVVCSDRRDFDCLWANNPFCELADVPADRTYSVRFEEFGATDDWLVYRPQRVLLEMTGVLADPDDVDPALYYDRAPIEKRLVVCDQAHWECRRGYPYLNDLLKELRDMGWEVIYVRNTEVSERQIYCETSMIRVGLRETIEILGTASLFIGYDSGMAHLAAGMKVPSVLLSAATPPIVFRHRSCLYCLEACAHCCTDNCPKRCLSSCGNQNASILQVITGAIYRTGPTPAMER